MSEARRWAQRRSTAGLTSQVKARSVAGYGGRRRSIYLGMLLGITVTITGCVKAPDIVIVDRTTALEQQASGRFVALERELAQAGVSPRPQPYTRKQLDAVGWVTPRERDAIAQLAEAAVRDRERLDGLLLRRCIGEASTADLVLTRKSCQGAVNTAAVSRLITRANRGRRQMWLYLRRTTRRNDAAVRKAWRAVHLVELPCGAWMQSAGGAWTAKKC